MRRTGLLLGAIAVIAPLLLPLTAQAVSDPTISCGDTVVNSFTGGRESRLRACTMHNRMEDGSVQRSVHGYVGLPGAWDMNKWTACKVVVVLAVKAPGDTVFQHRTRREMTGDICVNAFKFASGGNGTVHKSGTGFVPQAGYCYRAVTSWTGTYNGAAIGSSVNAVSPAYCGTRTTPGIPADGVIDEGVDAPDPVIIGLPE